MDDIATVPLVGDHPGLDLVNTAERDPQRPWTVVDDALRSPSDVRTWAVRVGILDSDDDLREVDLSAALRALRAYRESLYVVLLSLLGELDGRDARVVRALAAIQGARAHAVARSQLLPPPPGDRRLLDVVGHSGPDRVVDRVSVAAIELLTGAQAARIKRCPVDDGGCGWFFVDGTKNRSRRWCRMADCGTAVKSQRLTERRRERRRAADGEVP